MSFNRAQKTAPRISRFSGEHRSDFTSVADMFSFTSTSSLWKSGSAGKTFGETAKQGAPRLLGHETQSQDRVDWHKTLGQMKDLMSKAEKIQPGSHAAEEAGREAEDLVRRLRKTDSGLLAAQRSPCNADKAERAQQALPQLEGSQRGSPAASRPATGIDKVFRRSQSHGSVGRLLAGPDSWSMKRSEQASADAAEPQLAKAPSLPRLQKRHTTGF